MNKIISKVAFSHKSASFFVYLCNESKKMQSSAEWRSALLFIWGIPLNHSTVTDFARFRGISTLQPFTTAM